jgi:hypothetical protein
LEHRESRVTDLAIVHGVLRNPAMRGLGFFCFRAPESSRRAKAELAGLPGYVLEQVSSTPKLESLRLRIWGRDAAVWLCDEVTRGKCHHADT